MTRTIRTELIRWRIAFLRRIETARVLEALLGGLAHARTPSMS